MSTTLKIAAGLFCAAALTFAAGMQSGKVDLKSAGALAIGPDGILFVGDTLGAKIVALDVDDRTASKSAANLEIKGVNEKGELVDPWGTPYFFHQLSAMEMEIRSAGPDRIMWTEDDLVIK